MEQKKILNKRWLDKAQAGRRWRPPSPGCLSLPLVPISRKAESWGGGEGGQQAGGLEEGWLNALLADVKT